MAVQWYYQKLGQEIGPVTANELKQLAAGGQLAADDLVRKEGLDRWVRADKVQGLFPDRPAAVPQPRAPETLPVAKPVEVLEVLPVAVAPPQWERLMLKAFHRHVQAYRFLHVFPDIPARELTALKDYAPLHPNELPLCMYVPTFGPGWMLTTQHIYDAQHGGARRKLPLRRVRPREIEIKKWLLTTLMQVDGDIALTVHGLNERSWEGLEDFLTEGSALAREHAPAIDRANWEAVYGRAVTRVEALILEAFEERVGERSFYVPPDLTPKQVAGARQSYAALNPHELILGVLDITGRGSASLGCSITTQGIYWKTASSGAEHVRYDQLDPIHLHRSDSFQSQQDDSDAQTSVVVALREMLKKPYAETVVAFFKEAVGLTHEYRSTIEADEKELAARAERRLAGAPSPCLYFCCAGCSESIEVAILGTIDCPRCHTVLEVPKHSPCPKCRSKNTEFSPDRSPSSLTRMSVGLGAHGVFGLFGGAMVGHFLIAAMTSKAIYGCRDCKHQWALRLVRGRRSVA